MQLFFDLYKILPAENCRLLLASMVQMASVRRSLFNAEGELDFRLYFVKLIDSKLTPYLRASSISDNTDERNYVSAEKWK